MPFALDLNGEIAFITDPNAQVQQHIDALISTSPGERAMQPGYGVSLSAQLFSVSADVVQTMVINDVQQALNTYEPSVNVLSIAPISSLSDPTQGIVGVEVDYTISMPASTTPATTVATILPGGQVLET